MGVSEEKNTLIVNLYAGPGAGKSTGAAYLFYRLKSAGINAEYVTEFAKDKTWEGADCALHCQPYITGKQIFRIRRVYGKVDVIVTDSPIALGSMYADSDEMKALCISEAKRFPKQMNFFINRRKAYNPSGRNQTYEESCRIDESVKKMLETNHFHYVDIDGDDAGYDLMARMVLSVVSDEVSK